MIAQANTANSWWRGKDEVGVPLRTGKIPAIFSLYVLTKKKIASIRYQYG